MYEASGARQAAFGSSRSTLVNRDVMLIGHQAIWKDLLAEAASGRLHHAQLFVGQESIGKTKCAIELATHLQGVHENPLERAQLAQGLDADTLLFLDDGEPLSIETVRKIIARSGQSHARPYLIIILENLGRMKVEAMNTLLKTLEEPHPDVFFFLTANKESEVLPTIRSRCHLRFFESVSNADMEVMCAGHVQTQALLSFAMGRPGKLRLLLDNSEYFSLHQDIAQDLNDFLPAPRSAKAFALVRKYENHPNLKEFMDLLLLQARPFILKGLAWAEFLEQIEQAKLDLKQNVNKRLVLENLFLTLAL